jgi:7-cyano-7-deazaguanine synthase
MKRKSIILLSGGLDSAVSAAIARRYTCPVFALTLDYGQRAAKMEIAAAKKICRALKIRHRIIRLPFFSEFKELALLDSRKKVEAKRFRRLQDVWVPNRNGLLINIAACFAEFYGVGLVITGFNREEAREFPDNSDRFVHAISKSLGYSTLNKVKVKSYVSGYTKRKIYQLGLKYKVPLTHVYSCYMGGRRMCGRCASCRRLIDASKQ